MSQSKNVTLTNDAGVSASLLKGTDGVAHVKLADSYSGAEGVTKIAMLVWDTQSLSWVKYTGTATGGASGTVSVSNFPAIQPTSVVGFSNISVNGQISVTSASTTLLATNTTRKYVHIINNNNTTVYIQYGIAAIANRGLKLNPGAILTLSGSELYMGQINAISAGSSTLIDILEGV